MNIPEEIKKQIEGEAEIRFSKRIDTGDKLADDKYYYSEGMFTGFSFAQKQIEQRDKEIVELKKEVGEFDYKLDQTEKQLSEKENRIRELEGMLDNLSNGEKMNVIKTGDGQYQIIFKSQP